MWGLTQVKLDKKLREKIGEIKMTWKDIVKEDDSFFAKMKGLLDKYGYGPLLTGQETKAIPTLEDMIELCQEELEDIKELGRRANEPTDKEGYPY